MSEYQNKAVDLLIARHGEADVLSSDLCRERFLEEAIKIYRGLGGTPDSAAAQFRQIYAKPPASVVGSIGEVMIALAGISRLSDIDMMQAGYNTLDEGTASQANKMPPARIRRKA